MRSHMKNINKLIEYSQLDSLNRLPCVLKMETHFDLLVSKFDLIRAEVSSTREFCVLSTPTLHVPKSVKCNQLCSSLLNYSKLFIFSLVKIINTSSNNNSLVAKDGSKFRFNGLQNIYRCLIRIMGVGQSPPSPIETISKSI